MLKLRALTVRLLSSGRIYGAERAADFPDAHDGKEMKEQHFCQRLHGREGNLFQVRGRVKAIPVIRLSGFESCLPAKFLGFFD